MCVPQESLHSALSTSVRVLSSFTVSESGVLSSYSTAAEYIPERRRPRTSSSPASIWSRLSTEPLALRRTMVLQRALTAPRMCPALKARKERQSSSRHLALSSLRIRFSTGQSISPRSSIARRVRLRVRASLTLISSLCLHRPPNLRVLRWIHSASLLYPLIIPRIVTALLFTLGPVTSLFLALLLWVWLIWVVSVFSFFFMNGCIASQRRWRQPIAAYHKTFSFPSPFPLCRSFIKKTSMKRETMGLEIRPHVGYRGVWHSSS